MADDVLNGTGDWTQTKEAVANFRKLLLCSKCNMLLTEPVCLGVCEHMLCRSCAGSCAGDGCVVCQSPAWVKDLQINRNLSHITQLFCSLESLLNLTDAKEPCQSPLRTRSGNEETEKQQKNFKIWYSPRSRKVRCKMQRTPTEESPPGSAPAPETTPQNPDTSGGEPKDLSIFDFISSQDSGSSSSCPQTRTQTQTQTRAKGKRTRKRPANVAAARRRPARARLARMRTGDALKEQRLVSINQLWGLGAEREAPPGAGAPEARRSGKRVSFRSPAGSQNPEQAAPQGNPDPGSASTEGAPQGRGPSETIGAALARDQGGPSRSTLPEHTDAPEPDSPASPPRTPKRPRAKACGGLREGTPKRPRAKACGGLREGTPKRPRTSPGPRGQRLTGGGGDPAVLATPPSQGRLVFGRSPGAGQTESPGSVGRRSPARSLQGSPAVMKRNHKGETPLHLAAIKGDVDAAKELLDQGADPNLKDHAGWTPLHEACNLGHVAVVTLLLARGALLNTPGYENDSPLHDAVRNGHPAVARLLLQHGASQSVLNLRGKRPADFAASPEMREVFRSSPEAPRPGDRSLLGSPSSLAAAVSNEKRGEQMVVLASKLSTPQQKQLAKLVRLLGMKPVETFSGAVSHVVVPDGAAPTTLSSLQGVLAGCWLLGFSWVEACLKTGECLPEAEYEAGEGPQRGRINKYNLLPPLFDGCFFFLLGPFGAPPRHELLRLLADAGGRLLARQPKPDSDVTQTLSAAAYHAAPGSDQALCTQYVLYDPRAAPRRGARNAAAVVRRRGKVWTAPASWVVECIAAFAILPVPEC